MARNVMRDFGARDHLDWTHMEAIRRTWKGRFLLKGIVHPEDARRARGLGVDGIIVSNHGGRQLDGMVSPLRVLPAIVEAVPDLPVLMDSGVRRGTDIMKAFALGARFVFVGRPFLFAAVIAEEAGVRHGIRLLNEELQRDMALAGINSLGELGPDSLLKLG